MTAKYGTPYFQNFISSDLDPGDVRSMCCRLQLDKRELRKRGGGLFGSDELTGSVGVVTINLPRIGYLAKGRADLFSRLDDLMDLAARSLEIKRKVVSRLLEGGLFPYTRRYLGSFDNHFNTIGLVGMHECCLNFLGSGIDTPAGRDFSLEVLAHMRERLQEYQVETGQLFNLEATPAESTSYRLAKHDKEKWPQIICSGVSADGTGEPYYTELQPAPRRLHFRYLRRPRPPGGAPGLLYRRDGLPRLSRRGPGGLAPGARSRQGDRLGVSDPLLHDIPDLLDLPGPRLPLGRALLLPALQGREGGEDPRGDPNSRVRACGRYIREIRKGNHGGTEGNFWRARRKK